jgi:ER membrane protein complex subunit 2
VAVASLLCGHLEYALSLIMAIARQFPDSTRASRLLGMHFEATGDYAQAEELYKKELERDPQSVIICRRLIGLAKAQGDLPSAISSLRHYLDTRMTDVPAWEEAAALYLRGSAFSQALFCLEEVLLHQPGNINAQLLLAEALYSSGGHTNIELAKGYYAGVLEATGGNNIRGLFGVCACSTVLEKGRLPRDKDSLGNVAAQTLLERYAVDSADKLLLIKSMLQCQGFAV